MIYLDSAATKLQKPKSVYTAMDKAIMTMTSPGRGGHKAAWLAAETAFACREKAAKMFGMENPEHVVFTFNATHGLNIAIKSLVHPGDAVLISGYEHNAVVRPLHAIKGVSVRVAAGPLFYPDLLLNEIKRLMTPEIKVVICTHVSNVFGYVLPIPEIAQLCKERNKSLIIDASQSAGCLPIEMDRWGADFISMPGHKGLYGPQGTGLLLCAGDQVQPLLQGGTGGASALLNMPEYLPDRLEAGTHNVPGIAGLLEGIRYLEKRGIDHITEGERKLALTLARYLSELPGVEVFYAPKLKNQVGLISFRTEQMDCEKLAEALGEAGIAVRAGLHCAPLAHRTAETFNSGTVRVGFSDFNHPGELHCFVRELKKILK